MQAFDHIPAERIAAVVDRLVAEGILFDEEGVLWLGRKGEQEFGRKNFLELFSVFTSPLFAVRHGRQELGFVDETTFLSSYYTRRG